MAKRAEYLGPARRRPMVLDAALAIFAEGGFAEASMAAIAAGSGITKPVLYDCFPGGKHEIYLSLLEREEQRFLEHMTESLVATRELEIGEAIRRGLMAFLDYADQHTAAFVVLFGAPGTADPDLARRGERVRERIVSIMGQRAGRITERAGQPSVTGEIYIRSIVAIADHLARWWVKDKPVDREVIVDTVVRWLMTGLEGFVPAELLAPQR